jgi:hypothetical protein
MRVGCRWVMSTTTHVFLVSEIHARLVDQGTRVAAVSRDV